MKLVTIVGARPQFIKAAPLVRALQGTKVAHTLVHTGQHYDYEMSRIFFDELELPEPPYHLGAGSGTHGEQTAEILRRTEDVLLREQPDWVLVYGDTNSTLAGALAAVKLHIPVAHVEAGLRSFNRRMPEEINRVVTDHVASLLCCPTATAVANLEAEGLTRLLNAGRLLPREAAAMPRETVSLSHPLVANTGDVMYDVFLLCQDIADRRSTILAALELGSRDYYLATVHRAENTDNLQALAGILTALEELSRKRPVVWPLHPRTKKCLENSRLMDRVAAAPGIRLLPPLGFFDLLMLERHAAAVLTDSGGVQKEAFFAGAPCITLRTETEWVETVETGANVIVGTDPEAILAAAGHPPCRLPGVQPFGEGDAAQRIVQCLLALPLGQS